MRYRIWLKVGLARNRVSQKGLAEKLGMPVSCISEIVNGKKNPKSGQFAAMVDFLGVDPIEAIEFECGEYWKDKKDKKEGNGNV